MADAKRKPNTPQALEVKTFSAEYQVKTTASGKKELHGYASTYGNVDQVGDRVDAGAFTKTLSDRAGAIPYLWSHDTTQPLGKITSWNDDSKGLLTVATLSDIPKAHETVELVQDGVLGGQSIGYNAVKFVYEGAVRVLKELRLHEISAVVMPANADAVFTGVKGMQLKDFIGSFEALGEMVEDAIEESGRFGGSPICICGTFADHVIIMVMPQMAMGGMGMGDMDEGQYFQVDYAVGADGSIVLGDVTEVETYEIAQPKSLDDWLIEMAAGRYKLTTELKEGRVLSTRNKEAMSGAIEAMRAAMAALEDLLAAADPKPAKATPVHALYDLRALELDLAAMRQRAMLAAIGG